LADPRPLNWTHVATIVSVMVLVGTEVFAAALAGGWALAGLLELGDVVGHALMAAFSLAALYVMVLLWRRSTAIEPIRGRRRA
jgi:hypothetical protein